MHPVPGEGMTRGPLSHRWSPRVRAHPSVEILQCRIPTMTEMQEAVCARSQHLRRERTLLPLGSQDAGPGAAGVAAQAVLWGRLVVPGHRAGEEPHAQRRMGRGWWGSSATRAQSHRGGSWVVPLPSWPYCSPPFSLPHGHRLRAGQPSGHTKGRSRLPGPGGHGPVFAGLSGHEEKT